MKLKDDQTSVVFLGSFNLRIFHPVWMAKNEILTPTECDAALDQEQGNFGNSPEQGQTNVLVSEPVSQTLIPGLNIVAETSRLVITATTQERHKRPLEMALSIAKVLPHSPISAIGLNRNFVLDMESEGRWHRIGHAIIPKSGFWDFNGTTPGTTNASVRYLKCRVENAQLNLVVGPAIEVTQPLVRVNCNYHFDARAVLAEKSKSATSAGKLNPSRQDSFRMSDFDDLLTLELWNNVIVDAFRIAESVDALGRTP